MKFIEKNSNNFYRSFAFVDNGIPLIIVEYYRSKSNHKASISIKAYNIPNFSINWYVKRMSISSLEDFVLNTIERNNNAKRAVLNRIFTNPNVDSFY